MDYTDGRNPHKQTMKCPKCKKVIKKDKFGEWEQVNKRLNMWQGHRCKKK